MKRLALALVAVVLLSTGCGLSPTSGAPRVETGNSYNVDIPNTDNVYVVEFNLKDGTRCVATAGSESGGIDCAW